MSTLATNAITDASGGNTATINSYTPTESNMAGRNRIINGDMRIDQRNAGAAVTASGSYPVDRFNVNNTSDGGFSAQQSSTVPAGFSKSVGITITASDSSLTGTQRLVLRQTIEGYNIADFNWGTSDAKTVTLSFKVRSSVTGTFSGSLRNSAGDRSYPFTYSISSANTWTDISVTIAGETTGSWNITNGEGILVFFSLGVGPDLQGTAGAWASGNYWGANGETQLVNTNGATFYLTGVQLEAGSVATPFEHRQYGQELALCQRYYWQSFTTGDPSSTLVVPVLTSNSNRFALPISQVPMRATPTVVSYNSSGTAGFVTEFSSGISRTISSLNPEYTSGGGYAQTTATLTNSIKVTVAYSAEL
jgi:hypothetical protein